MGKMDLEKLKRIINAGNAEEVLDFFRKLTWDEITELTLKEYEEVMDLCGVLRNKKTDKEQILDYFYDCGGIAGEEMRKELKVQENALIARFYSDCFLKIKEEGDLLYANTLVLKGLSLQTLAEKGEHTILNLKESMECYDNAAIIYQREKAELEYATTQMNKGTSLMRLAEQGEDIRSNLKESMECYDNAAAINQREHEDLGYADTQMNKGNSLVRLAEQGVCSLQNLYKAINCYDEATIIYQREKAELECATMQMNKGTCLVRLAEQGENTKQNLCKAIKCYDNAAIIYQREHEDLGYAHMQMNKGNSLCGLAEAGVDTIPNLEKSIKCFDKSLKTFRKESAELDVALAQMNKGNSLRVLAEAGVDSENTLEEAINCYLDVERIYKRERCFLPFIRVSLNHCLVICWQSTKIWDQGRKEEAIELIKSAKKIGEKAFNEGENIGMVSPLKKDLNTLLGGIRNALEGENELKKEDMERLEKKISQCSMYLLEIKQGVNRTEKVVISGNEITHKNQEEIKVSINKLQENLDGFISDIDEKGIPINKDDKILLKGWVDDLRNADEVHYKAFMNVLGSLSNDSKFKKAIDEAYGKDKSKVEQVKQRFRKLSSDVLNICVADKVKEYLPVSFSYIKDITSLLWDLSKSNPAYFLVILPLVATCIKKLKE